MKRAWVVAAACACTNGQPHSPAGAPGPTAKSPPGVGAAAPASVAPGEPPPTALPDEKPLPPATPVQICDRGVCRVADAAEAAKQGLTVVDLSDGWTPFVLRESTYRETYVGLATNTRDADLDELTEGKDNFLELFGIPPALSVLRRRFHDEIDRPCFAGIDFSAMARLDHDLVYTTVAAGQQRLKEYRTLRRAAERSRASPATIERFEKKRIEIEAIESAQARLACERLLPGRGFFRPGVLDWSTHIGLAKFERKNMVFGWGFLTDDTRVALGRPPLDAHHDALVRVLRERAVDATGVIEDGSVAARPNMVEGVTRALVEALGVGAPADLRAFWDRFSDFAALRVAVRMPPPPDYYAASMDLEVLIDRGDVWYELPFREDGSEKTQPRDRMPKLTLFVKRAGEKIPLVRYRTTIGNWRSEWKDGLEFWKYKNSDVGARVWRNIIGAPVWIPPDTTPPRDLVKKKKVKERRRKVVRVVPNSDVFGPGFASAYGLVMAPHVVEHTRNDGSIYAWDNQIRTHGSVDYTSILRRYSHGCHRLSNHLALRMFAFLLKHRPHKALGQQPLAWSRKFQWYDESDQMKDFEARISTRGYWFELTDPLPVYVSEGRIRGSVKKPVEEYVPKPTQPGPAPAAVAPADAPAGLAPTTPSFAP